MSNLKNYDNLNIAQHNDLLVPPWHGKICNPLLLPQHDRKLPGSMPVRRGKQNIVHYSDSLAYHARDMRDNPLQPQTCGQNEHLSMRPMYGIVHIHRCNAGKAVSSNGK
jgi:hypothetical protein